MLRFQLSAPIGRLVLTALFTSAIANAQTTWFVDASAPPPGAGTTSSPYSDLQFALAQPTTLSGDTLLVAPGVYFGGFDFLGKDVVVQSIAGAATTILDGGAVWPPPPFDPSPVRSVVSFESGEGPGAVLDGFTVRRGRGTESGPTGLRLRRGAGVYVVGASPTLRNLIVTQHASHYGAGMYFSGSTAHISACTVTMNTTHCYCSDVRGVGIYTLSPITVEDCTITSNTLAVEGGGVYADAGTFTGCTISQNNGWRGGGAYLTGDATLVECTLEGNSCGNVDGDPGKGGGVHGGTAIGCSIRNNGMGAHTGGGAYGSILIDCVLHGNRVHRPAFTNFHPVGGAGASSCTLVRCDVAENVAGAIGTTLARSGADGGGLLSSTATDSRIRGNIAYVAGQPSNGEGGAGAHSSTLEGCDVHDNVLLATAQASSSGGVGGGGVFGGTATRCRLWNNTAPLGAAAANSTLINCTVVGNVPASGGGAIASLYTSSATTIVRSSILWSEAQPAVFVQQGSVDVAYSDIELGWPGTGNLSADPLFQSEANRDFHLLASSPCIDTGDPLVRDPDGSRVDMGAYPFTCGAHSLCLGKVNSLGCTPNASTTGTPSTSGLDDFHVVCDNVLGNSPGLLLWSRVSDAQPFFNAILCIGSPIVRTSVQTAGGTGPGPNCTGHFDFFFSHAYMNAHGIVASETIFAQWYMRDAAHPDGTGVGLSDAVAFTVCP